MGLVFRPDGGSLPHHLRAEQERVFDLYSASAFHPHTDILRGIPMMAPVMGDDGTGNIFGKPVRFSAPESHSGEWRSVIARRPSIEQFEKIEPNMFGLKSAIRRLETSRDPTSWRGTLKGKNSCGQSSKFGWCRPERK